MTKDIPFDRELFDAVVQRIRDGLDALPEPGKMFSHLFVLLLDRGILDERDLWRLLVEGGRIVRHEEPAATLQP